MIAAPFRAERLVSLGHEVSWIEAGPTEGPLMILLHGWPELGLVWRPQVEHFAARGWRCVAPDMRGYGASSVPTRVVDYALRAIVDDMLALHKALGGNPALWVGHDWGSAIAWSLAAHHPQRCRGVAGLCVPYFPRGMTLDTLVSLVDRSIYPERDYPVGQWDYWLHHREHFEQSAAELAADTAATVALLYRCGGADAAEKPSRLATVRAQGGWFGSAGRAPATPRDKTILDEADYAVFVEAFERTGFLGANAWYLNDAANAGYAAEALGFGRLALPTLFIHAARDATCETVRSRLADPMRAACADLTEIVIDAGHEVMRERPIETNAALDDWIAGKITGGRSQHRGTGDWLSGKR